MSTGPDAPIDVRRSLEAARDALAAGRLREVFRAALVAVALVRGRDRTLIYANPAFAALFPVTARVGEGTPVVALGLPGLAVADRKSTRLNSSHSGESRMPSSA